MSSRALKKCWWWARRSAAPPARPTRASRRAAPRRREDAGHLHLELDRPVLVEVPVEAVLVVSDGGDERDDEPAGAADLGVAAAPVDVLPEEAEVLLVDADGVGHGNRAAPASTTRRRDSGSPLGSRNRARERWPGCRCRTRRRRRRCARSTSGSGRRTAPPCPRARRDRGSAARVPGPRSHGVDHQPLARREADAHRHFCQGSSYGSKLGPSGCGSRSASDPAGARDVRG